MEENNFDIREVGESILDAVGDVFGGFGVNFQANADTNAANAQRIAVNTQLAVMKFQADQAARAKQQQLIEKVVFAVLALIFVTTTVKTLEPLLNKFLKS